MLKLLNPDILQILNLRGLEALHLTERKGDIKARHTRLARHSRSACVREISLADL